MKITIHSGAGRIGGCVTEYESDGWKLFVDYGEQLPGTVAPDTPVEIDGLTCGDISKSALLITHYHGDHIARIAELSPALPVFMGKISKEIALELSAHLSTVSDDHRRMAERLEGVNTFAPGEQFSFGGFRIMPVVIDHSAFDAYAFRIDGNGLKVFHTGDFRAHGFRSGKLPQLIEKYIGKVDYVVCEATNVNRPAVAQKSESALQQEYESAFRDSKYNVVYVSSTNIDRLFGLYHAAVKARRPFYVDSYQKRIMDIVAGRHAVWGKSLLYNYVEDRKPIELQRDGSDFRINDKFRDYLEARGYVVIARANERFDRLLSRIPETDRRTFLSMWDGYLKSSSPAYNPDIARSVGPDYEYLHTSGHCDMAALDRLLEMLRPYAVIPIHTDDPQAFADRFSPRWPVILLADGESFSAIRDPGYDNTTAEVYACKEPDGSLEVVENPDGLKWWMLDRRCLGEFQQWDDADDALHHLVYAPGRLLAYEIESNEDMAPWIYAVYNPDFTEHSVYEEGGHEPGGYNYQQPSPFKPGDRALAIIHGGFDVVIPCEIVGPLTEEYVRQQYDAREVKFHDSYEEYVGNFFDWDWDSVIVRPLVRLKNKYEEMPDVIDVQRIYLFPISSI